MTNRLNNNDYYSNKIFSIIDSGNSINDITSKLRDMLDMESVVTYKITIDYTHDKENAYISVQWKTKKNDIGICISPINIEFMKEVENVDNEKSK